MNPKSIMAPMGTRNLLVVVLCAAFTSSACAARLSSNFIGPFASGPTNASVPLGGTVTVEVAWTQDADDAANGLNSLVFLLTSVPEDPAPGLQGDRVEDPDLVMHDVSATLPGWTDASISGPVGGLSQFGVGATFAPDSLDAQGTTIIGTFQITVDAGASMGLHPFYILRSNRELSPEPVSMLVDLYSYASPPSAYLDYDIGGGFAGSNVDVMRADDAIPMMINVVPEPATLALLSLGMIVLRRRRT